MQASAQVVVPRGRVAERREAARRRLAGQLARARLARAQRLQAVPARRPGLPAAAAAPQGVRRRGHLHLRRPPVLNSY